MMFAVIDIETTGGNYKSAKITEIAILLFDGKKIVRSFETLVNPECPIPPMITKITGISNEMVANAPRFYEIARQIVELTAHRVFVAHNVDFDYGFIRKEFADLGYSFRLKKLCTVQLSRKYFPGLKSYSLGNICPYLGIKIENRHRAGGDARATVQLLSKILEKQNEKENSLFS
ncbi:MAG TPA: 3'-5' exonuclease [Prolixibacteraceae bacterium]|nr:3'-5' exonuclease [Prolixibacteraceae bacterium]